MKRILLILFAALMAFTLFSCDITTNPPEDTPPPAAPDPEPVSAYRTTATPTNLVRFEMDDGKTFVVELLPEYAPETVENFKALVSRGFYDGLTFHRISKGYMIQGGDPLGNGTGESETTIHGEFADNGFTQNTLLHERGVISMARRVENDSASCQFFIVHETTSSLDGKYAAFGRVVEGMETIDAIANAEVTKQTFSAEKSKPVNPPVMKTVTFAELIPAS